MPLYFAVSPEGFVDGLLTMDERAAAAYPLKPGYRLMKTTPEASDAVRLMGKAAVVRDGRIAIMPERAAIKWDAARGLMLGTLTEDRERRRSCRGQAWWRRAVERAGIRELAEDDPAWAGPAARELPRPRCVVPFTDAELAPDLWVRQIVTEADMADFQARVLTSKLFEEGDEDTEARIARWLYGPQALPLMVTWRGEVLQFECYHFDPNEVGPETARAGFNTHVDDERPYWFWAVVAQPALQAIRAAGYLRLESNVIAGKGDYLAALQHYYGGTEIGRTPDGRWARVTYELDDALGRGWTWPARPTAGPGWSAAAGAATLREAAEADLPAMRAAIDAGWPADQRDAMHRQLDKWWQLDRAAILIGTQGGEIRYLRASRLRRPGIASLSWLLPAFGTPAEQQAVTEAFFAWHRLAGFTKATMHVPLAVWQTPRVQALIAASGHREVARRRRHRGEVVETEVDL